MRLLLKEDVPGLGFCGDEVEVKGGYGRNFLIPNGQAILATPKNLKQFNHQKSIVQARLKKIKTAAEALGEKISGVTCLFRKKVGDQGKLFGSVTSQDISDNLRSQGIELDRRKILLSEPIKAPGDVAVSAKLHPEVTIQFKVTVAREETAAAQTPEPEKENTAS